jgi:hypothetical protein
VRKNELVGVLRWEDPPPPVEVAAVPRRAWAMVAAELRDEPGRWGLIDDACTGPHVAQRIKAGVGWWSPAGSFDACTRSVEGRLHVYARYVGAVSDA